MTDTTPDIPDISKKPDVLQTGQNGHSPFRGMSMSGEASHVRTFFPAADDGEQGPDTDGLAAATGMPSGIATALLEASIARKEAANEALVAKLAATMADMRSLQRQSEQWRAECQRLSALLVETQQELAQRMVLPARALRFGRT